MSRYITPPFLIRLLAVVPLTLLLWLMLGIGVIAVAVGLSLAFAAVPFLILFGKWTVKK